MFQNTKLTTKLPTENYKDNECCQNVELNDYNSNKLDY